MANPDSPDRSARRYRFSARRVARGCACFLLLVGTAGALFGQLAGESMVERPVVGAAARPAQDLVFEGLASYGNYRIFAGGSNCHLYTGGVEYDRHSWGRWLWARRDYSADFLPVMILNEPAVTDIWGDTTGPGRKILYGMGLFPVGMRLVWLDGKRVRPYFNVKGGVLVFDGKVLSKAATYEQFSLQESVGLLVRQSPRYDVRLGLFGDFHFSNAFMTNVNPGLDVMNFNVGIVYHLGQQRMR